MKKIISVFTLAYLIFVTNHISMANTFPTGPGYRYIIGCFGEERYNKKTKKFHDHKGIDLVGPKAGDIAGEAIYALKKGIVVLVRKESSYGNRIEILHEDGTKTRYAHMQNINAKIKSVFNKWKTEKDPAKKKELKEKLKVTEGQTLGTVGTGGPFMIDKQFSICLKGHNCSKKLFQWG